MRHKMDLTENIWRQCREDSSRLRSTNFTQKGSRRIWSRKKGVESHTSHGKFVKLWRTIWTHKYISAELHDFSSGTDDRRENGPGNANSSHIQSVSPSLMTTRLLPCLLVGPADPRSLRGGHVCRDKVVPSLLHSQPEVGRTPKLLFFV